MGYLGKKKEWDSGVQYDKLNLSTDSDMFGCLSFLVIVCVAGLAIWHFCFTDARLAFREYMIYAIVCIVAIVYVLYRFFGEQECWYVDYEGMHVHTYSPMIENDPGVLQTYKWEDIYRIKFKYSIYNDEYTDEGDKIATYRIIIETISGERITRILTNISDFKETCQMYSSRNLFT